MSISVPSLVPPFTRETAIAQSEEGRRQLELTESAAGFPGIHAWQYLA